MADKTPKNTTAGKPAAQDPESNKFFGGDDPLDLSELDSILDDNTGTDFPASDTGLGFMPEPPPLPPTDEMTASASAPPLRPEDTFEVDDVELASDEASAAPRDVFEKPTRP